jgi:predicted outer membrane repeat protein
MKHSILILYILVLISQIMSPDPLRAQQVRYVAPVGVDADNNCLNAGSPCATIPRAISQASPGDTVDVAAGAYTESITINKTLVLRGAGENNTIIQAHVNPGMASERVITLANGLVVLINDVTIRHGNTNGWGGGIFNDGSTLALKDVTFTNNNANLGGGLAIGGNASTVLTDVKFNGNHAFHGGGAFTSSYDNPAQFTNVSFNGNTAEASGGGLYNFGNSLFSNVAFVGNSAGAWGGGIINQNSSPVLSNVEFIDNEAEHGGGIFNLVWDGNGGVGTYISAPVLNYVSFVSNAATEDGGGMYEKEGTSMLTNVIFTENQATRGGGMFTEGGEPTLKNVVFTENLASSSGGGTYNLESRPVIIGSVYNGNKANFGGGMTNNNSSPELVNVTISGNEAITNNGGGMRNIGGALPVLTNTIVWGNTAATVGNEIYNSASGSVELRYSLYKNEENDIVEGEGFTVDEFSITGNPRFADAVSGDLRLGSGSPAIDAGYPDTDLTLFLMNDDELPVDLDGNSRVFNGRIDLGAYEYNEPSTNVEEIAALPTTVELHQNYPNPFNPATMIIYALPEQTRVELAVFDMLGRRIAVLVDDHQPAGLHEVQFTAGDISSGIYLYRLRAGEELKTGRMVLMR